MSKKKPRKQCETCPWKADADPHAIPNGYSCDLHKGLAVTIARPDEINIGGGLRIMACHYSKVGKEIPCVGWMVNQLGAGNNIGLRLAAIRGDVDADVESVGKQHERFEDTLPEGAE